MPLMLAFLLFLLLPSPGHMTHLPVWKLNITLSLWHSCLLPMHDPALPLKPVYSWKCACWWRARGKNTEGESFSGQCLTQTHMFVRERIFQGFWKKTRLEVEWVNISKEMNCHGVVTSLAGWERPKDNRTFNKGKQIQLIMTRKWARSAFPLLFNKKTV